MSIFFDVIRQGERYLQSWPKQRVLNCLFIDSKVTFYTRLAIKTAPAFVILVVALNVLFPAILNWQSTSIFVVFLLGLPVQGLYWLGKRSQQFLPNQLLPWYGAIHKKLSGNRTEQADILQRPRYLDLALLLKRAFRLGGDKFLQHHELL